MPMIGTGGAGITYMPIYGGLRYHVRKDCRSLNRCRKCGGRHHSSICSKIAPRNPRKDNPTMNAANHPPVAAAPNLLNASLPSGLNPQASHLHWQLPQLCAPMIRWQFCSKLLAPMSIARQAHSQWWRSECSWMAEANALMSRTVLRRPYLSPQ